jgi:hypothetical protein
VLISADAAEDNARARACAHGGADYLAHDVPSLLPDLPALAQTYKASLIWPRPSR